MKITNVEPHSLNPNDANLENPTYGTDNPKPSKVIKFVSNSVANAKNLDKVTTVLPADDFKVTIKRKNVKTTKYRKVALEAKFGEMTEMTFHKNLLKMNARTFYQIRHKQEYPDAYPQSLPMILTYYFPTCLHPFKMESRTITLQDPYINYTHLSKRLKIIVRGQKRPCDIWTTYKYAKRDLNGDKIADHYYVFFSSSFIFYKISKTDDHSTCFLCGAPCKHIMHCECGGPVCSREGCMYVSHQECDVNSLPFIPNTFLLSQKHTIGDMLYQFSKIRKLLHDIIKKPELFYLPERLALKDKAVIEKHLQFLAIDQAFSFTDYLAQLEKYYSSFSPLFSFPAYTQPDWDLMVFEIVGVWQLHRLTNPSFLHYFFSRFDKQYPFKNQMITHKASLQTRSDFLKALGAKKITELPEAIENTELRLEVSKVRKPRRPRFDRRHARPLDITAPIDIEEQMFNGVRDASRSFALTADIVSATTVPKLNNTLDTIADTVNLATTTIPKLNSTLDAINDATATFTNVCGSAKTSVEAVLNPTPSFATVIANSILEIFRVLFPKVQFDLSSAARLALLVTEIFCDDRPITARSIFFYMSRIFLEFTNTSCEMIRKIISRIKGGCVGPRPCCSEPISIPPFPQSPKPADTQQSQSAEALWEDMPEIETIEVEDQAASSYASRILSAITSVQEVIFGARAGILQKCIVTTQFIERLAKLPDTLHSFLITYLKYLPTFIKTWVAKTSGTYAWNIAFKQGGCYFSYIQYSIAAINTSRAGGTISQNQWKAIDRAEKEVTSLYIQHPKNPPPSAMTFFNARKHELSKLRALTDPRVHEPFVIYLYGTAGLGKTTISKVIAAFLLKLDSVEAVEQHIYVRNPNSEFWDGYRGQKVVIYDDFAQDRVKEADIAEMIQVVSATRYQPNFSNLASQREANKGDYFNSPYVIVLSNQLYPRVTSINSVEALYRRRHVIAELTQVGSVMKDDFSHLRFTTRCPFPEDSVPNNKMSHWRGVKLNETLSLSHFFQRINTALFYSYDLKTSTRQNQNLLLKKLLEEEDTDVIPDHVLPLYQEDIFVEDKEEFFDALNVIEEHMMTPDEATEEIITLYTTDQGRRLSPTVSVDSTPDEMPDIRTVNGATFQLPPPPPIDPAQPADQLSERLKTIRELRATTLYSEAPKSIQEKIDDHLSALEKAYLNKKKWINIAKQHIRSLFNIWEWPLWCRRVAGVAALVGAAGAIYGIYKVIRIFKPNIQSESSEIFTRHQAKKPPLVTQRPQIRVINGHLSDALQTKLEAMVMLELRNDKTGGRVAATPVKGRIITTVKHFFDTLNPGDAVTIFVHRHKQVTEHTFRFNPDETRHCSFDSTDAAILKAAGLNTSCRDLCFYQVPIQVPSFPDYTSRFIPSKLVTDFKYGQAVVLFIDRTQISPYTIRSSPKQYSTGACATAIEYEANTRKGDCGSPIFIDTDKLACNLFGIHFGGSKQGKATGYAMIITRELVDDVVKDYIPQITLQDFSPKDVSDKPCYKPGTSLELTFDSNLYVVGKAARPKHQKLSTTITPSYLHEVFGPRITEPSILHSFDPRLQGKTFDPLFEGMQKFGETYYPFPERTVQAAISSLKSHLLRAHNKLRPQVINRLLTEEEMLNGIPHIPNLESMDMRTSPGYPYNRESVPNKRALFTEPPYMIQSKTLRTRFDERERLAREGIRVATPWEDCLKDERRALKKIYDKPATRCFNIPPVDYTMLGRKYCLGFIAWMYSLHTEIFLKAGMDPFSPEWNKMVQDLLGVDNRGFNYDYKLFDSTQFIGYIAFLELTKWFYNGFSNTETETTDDLVRRVLVDESVHTASLCQYFIYMKHKGTPSGAFLTMIVNCLAAEMYLRMAYFELNPANTMEDFDDTVGRAIMGDDGVISTRSDIKSWYNIQSIAQWLLPYKVYMTPGDKTDTLVEYVEQPIPFLTFCKRQSYLIGDIYYSALSYDVIIEMMYWYHADPLIREEEAVEQIVLSAMRELFVYGRKAFNFVKNKIESVAHSKGYSLSVPSFTHFESEFNERYLTDYSRLSLIAPDQFNTRQEVDDEYIMIESPELNLGGEREELEIVEIEEQSTIEGDAMQAASAFQTTSVGATLHEETVPQKSSFNLGRVSTDDGRAESTINEPAWSLEKQLGRWSFVKHFTWDVTQVPAQILFAARVIQDLIVSSLQSAPFTNFRYVRWKTVRVKILVNGNKFYPGQLCGFFVPYTTDEVARQWQAGSLRGMTQMQNVMIAANKSGIGILELDFRYPYNWFDLLGNHPPVGMLYVAVFNQLVTTLTTPAAIDVNVWIQIEGAKFKVPLPAHPTLSLADMRLMRKGILPSVRREEEQQIVRRRQGVRIIEGQMFEQAGASVGKELDKIVEEVIPDNIVGGLLDAMGGMDKPTNSGNPQIFRQFPEGFLPHANNVEHYPKLQLYPNKQVLSDNEHFATKGPELLLYDLMRKRPNLLTTVEWDTTHDPGTVLFQAHVGPTSASLEPSSNLDPIQPTMMDYVSLPFNKWRGAVCYMAQAVATMFNTGRLLWTFYPEIPSDEVPTGLLSQSSSYVELIDMKDGVGIGRVVCPYLSDRPWKTVHNGLADGDVMDSHFSGIVTLSVATKLVAGNDSPNNIRVNIFTWAGDDYELNVYNYNNALVTEYDLPPPPAIEAHLDELSLASTHNENDIQEVEGQMYSGGTDLVENPEHPAPDVRKVQNNSAKQDLSFAPQVLGTEASTVPLAQTRAKTYDGGKVPHYGERFSSIKDLMKRFYYRRDYLASALTTNQSLGQDPVLVIEDPARYTAAGNGALSWYGRMWRFNRNGYRFKVRFTIYNEQTKAILPISRVLVTQIPVDSRIHGNIADYRSVFQSETYAFGNTANPPLASVLKDKVLEFEIPYVREENVMLNTCQTNYDSADPLYSHSMLVFAIYLDPSVLTEGETVQAIKETAIALSDEGMFGTFAGVPLIQLAPENTVNSTWYITPPPSSKRQETPLTARTVRTVAR